MSCLRSIAEATPANGNMERAEEFFSRDTLLACDQPGVLEAAAALRGYAVPYPPTCSPIAFIALVCNHARPASKVP
eukprot:m.102977 g.102977  ORF g.102977 m.102977 type:complete len:76 (-) comp14133_c1_seq3:26-253(-)